MGSLTELSADYFDSARLLSELIEKYRPRLALARRQNRFGESQRLERLLRYYYSQRHDLLITAHYLKNYYNR
jgi:hypothetical protein